MILFNKVRIGMNMKRNNTEQAFTITEIITTLVILGITLLIAIPGIGKLYKNFKEKYYKELDQTVLQTAKMYFKDNKEQLPSELLEYISINISDASNSLVSKKYIDTVNVFNENDKKCTGDVRVLKVQDEYLYKNCMICSTEDGLEWKTYDDFQEFGGSPKDLLSNMCHIDSNVVTEYESNDEVFLYLNNYDSQNIKELLAAKEKSTIYKDENGEKKILYQIETGNKIYPKNITAIPKDKTTISSGINIGLNVSFPNGTMKTVYIYEYDKPILKSNNVEVMTQINASDNNLRLVANNGEFKINETNITYPLKKPDNTVVFHPDSTKYFYTYEYYNNGNWKELNTCTGNMECSFNSSDLDIDDTIDNKVKFRTVGKDSEGKKYYGKSTDEYEMNSSYIITYHPNAEGVTNMPANQVKLPSYRIQLSSSRPNREGWMFAGWSTAPDSNTVNYSPGNWYYSDASLDLYAVWQPPVTLVNYIKNLYNDTRNFKMQRYISGWADYYASGSSRLMNDRLGGTTDGYHDGNIRYYGANPSNYVDIGDRYSWRIIGVFKDITVVDESGNRTKQDLIKVIRADSIGEYSWDLKPGVSSANEVNNTWNTAMLKNLLNGPFYESRASTPADEIYEFIGTVRDPILMTPNFSSKGLTETARRRVATVEWDLGSFSTVDISAIYPETSYYLERYDRATDTPVTKKWIGKIGLMYPSDYGYATRIGSGYCNYSFRDYSAQECKNNNWLFNIGEEYSVFTLSPSSYYSTIAWCVTNVVGVSGSGDNGRMSDDCYGAYMKHTFPVMYLSADLLYNGGTGSYSNPYKVK